MAQTATIGLTLAWQELAAGPAKLTMTTDTPDAFFAVREDEGAPAAGVLGHVLPLRMNTVHTVPTGSRLYVKGRHGNLTYTEDTV